MVSFAQLMEQMNEPIVEHHDAKTIAIRAGLNLSPEFWDDFLKLCNQSQALSELLGVRREVIASWPNNIREGLAQVQKLDGSEAAMKKATLITTGY